MIVKCKNCNIDVYKRPSQVKYYKNNFCSSKCVGIFNTTSINTNCNNCNKSIKKSIPDFNKSLRHFCSMSCRTIYYNAGSKRNFKNGSGVYRKIAIKEKGLYCDNKELCPLKEIELPSFMIEVHHKDHNRKNNDKDNLLVLCVWCHRSLHNSS